MNMKRYQPGQQMRDGVLTHLIVDTHTSTIHPDYWYSEDFRDATLASMDDTHNALNTGKRYQPGEMRNGERTIYTIVDTQTGEPLPDWFTTAAERDASMERDNAAPVLLARSGFEEGYDAYVAGTARDSNPYTGGRYLSWDEGWQVAEHETRTMAVASPGGVDVANRIMLNLERAGGDSILARDTWQYLWDGLVGPGLSLADSRAVLS